MHKPTLKQIISGYANRQLEQRKAWYSRAAQAYNQARPLTLLTTYSPYLDLESTAQQRLFNDLATIIDQEFEGKLMLAYTSAFHIAQKA